jgi:hypothetical protein
MLALPPAGHDEHDRRGLHFVLTERLIVYATPIPGSPRIHICDDVRES